MTSWIPPVPDGATIIYDPEQRRLGDRLTRVVVAAAALGVSIEDINAALDGARDGDDR